MDAGDATRPKPDAAGEVPLKDLPTPRRVSDRDAPKVGHKPEDDELRIEDLPPRKNITGG